MRRNERRQQRKEYSRQMSSRESGIASSQQDDGDEEEEKRMSGATSQSHQVDQDHYQFSDEQRQKAEHKVINDLKRGQQRLSLVDFKLQDLAFLGGSSSSKGLGVVVGNNNNVPTGGGGGIDGIDPNTGFPLQSTSLSGSLLTGMWDNVVEINVQKNFLSSIDVLNHFSNLRFLIASDNYIHEVSLNLPKLEELDLHNNFISRFPLLNQLNKLRLLNLNSNRIEDFRGVDFKPPSSLSLQQLDIGNNMIDFATNQDFYEQFLDKVKKLKNLRSVVIAGNPFIQGGAGSMVDQKKLDQIVAQLPQLEYINGDRAEDYRRAKNNSSSFNQSASAAEGQTPGGLLSKLASAKAAAAVQGISTKGGSKTKKGHTAGLYIPTLQTLCYNLEAANSHPSFALDHLKDLAFDVEKISEHLELVDEYFAKDKNEVEINDMIEDFMQNAQVLINNHFELQTIMLTILSKLSIVKFYDFGVRCFNTLKDLMIAGKDMEHTVTDIIRREVVLKLHQQTNPEMVPASLLQGLHELVKQTRKSEMLTGLYENCFPQWLRLLLARIQGCKRVATLYENNPHFDAVLALMSVSLQLSGDGSEEGSRRNAEKALEKDLGLVIADVLNESVWEQDRYLHCLKIVECLATQDKRAANQFIDKFIHQALLKNIKYSMQLYKKYNDLRAASSTAGDNGSESRETEARVRLKYRTLAAEIATLGGLLEAEEERRRPIVSDPVIDDLLQIISHYKTDPILLTAICNFARQLLSREELRTNPAYLEPKVKRMQSLVQLVPYLGMKKYEDLLRMSRRYYDQGGGGAAFADREKAPQLQHLDDVIAHELFIAIVQLMRLFCEEAEKPGAASAVFEEVSQSLNDASREAALFNCLEVPNDEVKLAVVECLNAVPLSEFDTEEISTILRLLSSCKNIGAGKTELVLAKIFWIMTKFCKDKEEESGRNFRIRFGERAVAEALDILVRNQSRALEDPDEEQEKLSLSLSCLHFLKFASANSDTKKYLLNRHEQLKQALYADEQCTSYDFAKCPVDVEETWLGRNLDVLLYAISGNGGNDSVSPYTAVSFRLLQRMADVLMLRREVDELPDLIDPYRPGLDVIVILRDHYRQKYSLRKRRERTYWPEPHLPEGAREPDSPLFNSAYKQHYWFTSQNGIALLRLFLTKRVPSCEQWLKREADQQFDKHNLTLPRTLAKAVRKAEEKEQEHQAKEEKKKEMVLVGGGKGSKGGEQEEELNGLLVLRKALQREELGEHYNEEVANEFAMLTNADKSKGASSAVQENIKKRDYRAGGIQNHKLRALCIAAYLRCLYAAIEYAPTDQLRREAVQQLQDVFVFRSLTQLCDTTGWLEAAIGAKYLRVMRHVIKAPATLAEEQVERLALYEIVARAVRKMLTQLRLKLNDEQQHPLQNEDKVLIYELAVTCQVLCVQAGSLWRWSPMPVKQQGAHARTRRSPQEKVVDKMISMLFPSQHVMTLIQIIFRDMDLSARLFALGDDDAALTTREPRSVQLKNHQARECIKKFLGEYIARCKDCKYEVLEAFMKGVVFDKRRLRESFLQEILKTGVDAGYRSSIEEYIFVNKHTIEAGKRETIVHLVGVEASVGCAVPHSARILIFTNKGIHLMKPPAGKPCTVCPPENLCPNGPRPELKFRYERLAEIIRFPDLTQRLILSFSQSRPENPQSDEAQRKDVTASQAAFQVSIIIPGYTSSNDTWKLLEEIQVLYSPKTKVRFIDDYLLRGSLERHVTKHDRESQLCLGRYLSHNPSKGFLGLGQQDSTIPSCALAVLTTSELIILKESFSKWWMHVPQREVVGTLLDRLQNGNQVDLIPQAQRQKEEKLQGALENVLGGVVRYRLDEVENMHVHKGKDAVIDIEFGRGKVEKLIFQCDYSRQEFIQMMVDIKQGRFPGNNEGNLTEEDDEEM